MFSRCNPRIVTRLWSNDLGRTVSWGIWGRKLPLHLEAWSCDRVIHFCWPCQLHPGKQLWEEYTSSRSQTLYYEWVLKLFPHFSGLLWGLNVHHIVCHIIYVQQSVVIITNDRISIRGLDMGKESIKQRNQENKMWCNFELTTAFKETPGCWVTQDIPRDHMELCAWGIGGGGGW